MGRVSYIGRLVNPIIAFDPSRAATKCQGLRVHHLRALNPTLCSLKNLASTIAYLSSNGPATRLEVFSNTAVNVVEDVTNVVEGILIMGRSGTMVHAIGWTSKRARREARSINTPELLAAAGGVDQFTFIEMLLEEIVRSQTSELLLDSYTAFHLCSTHKNPEEARNELILTSISGEQYNGSMEIICWSPGQTHLADALTKDMQGTAKLVDTTFATWRNSHHDSSYIVTTGVILPSQPPSPISCDAINHDAQSDFYLTE